MNPFLRVLGFCVLLLVWSVMAFAQEAGEAAAGDDTMSLLLGGLAGLIGLGVLISRFTKTDKDDAFFARLGGVFKSLKK